MATYSNGWGHLIVTIGVLAMGTFLIYTGKLDTAAVTALLGPTISFWFMSGSVNRFANSALSQNTAPIVAVKPGGSSGTTVTVKQDGGDSSIH